MQDQQEQEAKATTKAEVRSRKQEILQQIHKNRRCRTEAEQPTRKEAKREKNEN